MRGFNRLSRMCLTGGVLAAFALCLGSCGDYSYYDIHVTSLRGSDPTVRESINECELTIKTESGAVVLDGFSLDGCQNRTDLGSSAESLEIGDFSYSSSRTNAKLMFEVDAYNTDKSLTNPIQTGNSDSITSGTGSAGSPYLVLVGMH